MSPLKFSTNVGMYAPSSFEIEGMVKIQPMGGVEEKVLRSLGWTELHFLKERRLRATTLFSELSVESEIQMYYEFGIFSTVYGGEEMPDWIRHRSNVPSILFTIPSSPKQLRGLNFCYVLMKPEDVDFKYLPGITVSNITKNCTWTYKHYLFKVNVGGESVIMLSHWMFGMNEMEAGDQVVVTLNIEDIKECGVSFVIDEEEEDVLGYYKSWNHIIGKDLSAFQTTTGEYFLDKWRFLLPDCDLYNIAYEDLRGQRAHLKENLWFRALSSRKSDVINEAHEHTINRENRGETEEVGFVLSLQPK